MDNTQHLVADKSGLRLDVFLSRNYPQYSRSYIQRLVKEGYATVNGQPVKVGLKLGVGDEVSLNLPPATANTLEPESITLKITYEDDDLLVVDKPAGLTVHPVPGHLRGTLVNALLARYSNLPGEGLRPGIVHRLDKDTSGLMLVAKNSQAQLDLQRQLKNHLVVKHYLVLVKGRLAPQRGAIEAPVGRDPHNRKRMAVVSTGREAQTLYRVLDYLDGYTLLEVTPKTGRTHQIRVHLSAIGHPVAGDSVYGKRETLVPRQFLHASYLRFQLPGSGQVVEFTSPLPPDLEAVLRALRPSQ